MGFESLPAPLLLSIIQLAQEEQQRERDESELLLGRPALASHQGAASTSQGLRSGTGSSEQVVLLEALKLLVRAAGVCQPWRAVILRSQAAGELLWQPLVARSALSAACELLPARQWRGLLWRVLQEETLVPEETRAVLAIEALRRFASGRAELALSLGVKLLLLRSRSRRLEAEVAELAEWKIANERALREALRGREKLELSQRRERELRTRVQAAEARAAAEERATERLTADHRSELRTLRRQRDNVQMDCDRAERKLASEKRAVVRALRRAERAEGALLGKEAEVRRLEGLASSKLAAERRSRTALEQRCRELELELDAERQRSAALETAASVVRDSPARSSRTLAQVTRQRSHDRGLTHRETASLRQESRVSSVRSRDREMMKAFSWYGRTRK